MKKDIGLVLPLSLKYKGEQFLLDIKSYISTKDTDMSNYYFNKVFNNINSKDIIELYMARDYAINKNALLQNVLDTGNMFKLINNLASITTRPTTSEIESYMKANKINIPSSALILHLEDYVEFKTVGELNVLFIDVNIMSLNDEKIKYIVSFIYDNIVKENYLDGGNYKGDTVYGIEGFKKVNTLLHRQLSSL